MAVLEPLLLFAVSAIFAVIVIAVVDAIVNYWILLADIFAAVELITCSYFKRNTTAGDVHSRTPPMTTSTIT